MSCCDPQTMDWIKERIHDKKHFTARFVAQSAQISGMEPELLVKISAGLLFAILALSEQAHMFANFLLVAIPFTLIFIYPNEKPADETLFVFFTSFGILTVFDRSLEKIPLYYVLKLSLFLLFFLPPYRLVDKVEEFIKDQLKKDSQLTTKRSKRDASSRSAPIAPSAPAPPPAPSDPAPPPAEHKSQNEECKSERIATPTPSEMEKSNAKQNEIDLKSGTDLADGSKRLKVGQNPMENSSFHNLKSTDSGINMKVIGPGNNLNDLLFFPMNCLIFNAPFDYDNLTYHMKIRNNCRHRIAYAIKGNAVPRVMAYPPFGILEIKEERLVAVSVQKFECDPEEFAKDRIAFDYVILPDTDKSKNFDLKMFQNCDSKRRKNIRIMYNR